MKSKVELDDELLHTAQRYFRKKDLSALLNKSLKALIHMKASHRLAGLGCTEPNLPPIKRTRADDL
jgi:hypothetical protein